MGGLIEPDPGPAGEAESRDRAPSCSLDLGELGVDDCAGRPDRRVTRSLRSSRVRPPAPVRHARSPV